MENDMSAIDWGELYSSLSIILVGEPFPKPTDSVVEAFESDTGFRLPISYRGYTRVFGAGHIAGFCNIMAPLSIAPSAPENVRQFLSRVDLRLYNVYLREQLPFGPERSRQVYKDWERVSRLVGFAHEIGGDVWGFDPADVTDGSSWEYGIYYVPRGENESQLVATSFTEFIKNVCFCGQLGGDFCQERDELPYKTFEPAVIPEWFPKETVNHFNGFGTKGN